MDKLPVHSVFAYCGKLYKVMIANGCQSCSLKDNKKLCEEINDICQCTKVNRDDNTSIVYMEILRNSTNIALNDYRNINDASVEVVPAQGCEDCAFIDLCSNNNNKGHNLYYAEIANYFGACSSVNREDDVSVKFKISGTNPFIVLGKDKNKQVKDDTINSSTGRDAGGVSGANASHATYSNDNITVITPIINDKGYNNIHISIPDGFVIDVEASDLSIGHIVFKSLYISYDDIVYNLYESHNVKDIMTDYDAAIHKLENIARYYNSNSNNESISNNVRYGIAYDKIDNKYFVRSINRIDYGLPIFVKQSDAQNVIDNSKLRSILDAIFIH